SHEPLEGLSREERAARGIEPVRRTEDCGAGAVPVLEFSDENRIGLLHRRCLSLSDAKLVVPFIGRYQRSASRRIRLTRDHTCARLARDALVAEIARNGGLANEPHRAE